MLRSPRMKTKKGWERGEPATVGERKGGNGAQSLVIENGNPRSTVWNWLADGVCFQEQVKAIAWRLGKWGRWQYSAQGCAERESPHWRTQREVSILWAAGCCQNGKMKKSESGHIPFWGWQTALGKYLKGLIRVKILMCVKRETEAFKHFNLFKQKSIWIEQRQTRVVQSAP